MCVCLASEGGSAAGREGLHDGGTGRLPRCGVRPHEAVLDPGPGEAAFVPHAAREAAAHQI